MNRELKEASVCWVPAVDQTLSKRDLIKATQFMSAACHEARGVWVTFS